VDKQGFISSREWEPLDQQHFRVEPNGYRTQYSNANIGRLRAHRIADTLAMQFTIRLPVADVVRIVVFERGGARFAQLFRRTYGAYPSELVRARNNVISGTSDYVHSPTNFQMSGCKTIALLGYRLRCAYQFALGGGPIVEGNEERANGLNGIGPAATDARAIAARGRTALCSVRRGRLPERSGGEGHAGLCGGLHRLPRGRAVARLSPLPRYDTDGSGAPNPPGGGACGARRQGPTAWKAFSFGLTEGSRKRAIGLNQCIQWFKKRSQSAGFASV
jgi:hypothetical protein